MDWRGVRDGGAVTAGVVRAAAGEAVSTARVAVSTTGVAVSTAGVAAGVAAVVAAGVASLSLVVLSHLETLLDVAELDADDPVVRHAVDGRGRSVVRRHSVAMAVAVGLVSGLVRLVLDLVLQDDVLDLLQ